MANKTEFSKEKKKKNANFSLLVSHIAQESIFLCVFNNAHTYQKRKKNR